MISFLESIRTGFVNPNCFIDRRNFSNPEDLYKFRLEENSEKKKIQIGNYAPDIFNVNLMIRLKEASVTGAYGKEYKMKYAKSADIGNIGRKLDNLIESAEPSKSSYAKKLFDARNQFLKNTQQETVTFNVIADGIAGESSGGQIKGDVTVDIEAVTSKGKSKIFSQSIPFSLKSESVTVANLSPYNGMLDIAKAFGLEWKDVEKYDFHFITLLINQGLTSAILLQPFITMPFALPALSQDHPSSLELSQRTIM